MGLFDGRSEHDGERRAHSPSRSATSKGYYVRSANNRSSSSAFGGASRGIFSSGNNGSSSYYKRRPRDGYVSMLIHKVRKMLKELWYYAKKNPIKAFFAVVVPLISAGGAVHGILRQFGVRIPGVDGKTRHMSGGYYGSQGYGGSSSVFGGGGGGGWMDSAGSLMQVARAFM